MAKEDTPPGQKQLGGLPTAGGCAPMSLLGEGKGHEGAEQSFLKGLEGTGTRGNRALHSDSWKAPCS